MKVLLVDDQEAIRKIGRLALEAIGGHEVVEAADATAAIALAGTAGPDVVLLDVMMPGRDGSEVLAALRSNPATATLPVVFLTARVQPQDRSRYLAEGAIGVIAKPFDPMTLAAQLLDILEAR
jgi:two-component system, OmpR family, response regulator